MRLGVALVLAASAIAAGACGAAQSSEREDDAPVRRRGGRSEPLSAAVRRDLTRYIRSRHLRDPVIVGHSMGGFIAYWIASYHPELVGPVIIVDASPALSGGLDEAKELRTKWRKASDEEYFGAVRAKFNSMTHNPRRMAPVID